MRAILMAAGMGTRLRPLTEKTPKSLIEVNGVSLLERQIINLREIGVEEIIVVTGYLHEEFNDIVKKYNLIKLYNDKYDVYNNIYSLYVARDYLRDAFVIDADNYFTRNFLSKTKPETSIYYSACKENIASEWIFKYTESGRIYGIDIGDENSKPNYIMSGVSYWTEKDGRFMAEKVRKAVEEDKTLDIYWDNVAVDNYDNMEVYIEKIQSNDIFEIDTISDLEYLKRKLHIDK
ncbi:MAG: NTP transferase domain-containing protein [Clostridium sp.]